MSETTARLQPQELGIGLLFERIGEAVIVADVETGHIVLWNPTAGRLFGYTADEALGQPLEIIFPERLRARYQAGAARSPWLLVRSWAAPARDAGGPLEVPAVRATGEEISIEVTLSPLEDPPGAGPRHVLAVIRDVTERRRAQDLSAGQQRLLEMIATGTPLAGVLEALATFVEAQAPGLLASILLLDEDGVHLRHGAAPHLPESYNRAVDGMAIGPSAGSCGTAVYRRAPVVVTDIATDPLWLAGFSPIRALARRHNLRACWSSPIVASDGRVLGAFALYYREPRAPTLQVQHLIDVATDIAAIAIARQRADDEHAQLLREQGARAEAEALRARFEEVFRRAPALIGLVQGPEHVVEYANPLFIQTVGGRDCRGLPVRQAVPELAGQGYFELLDQVYATGEPAMGTEARVYLDRDGDGTPEEGFFNYLFQPTRDAEGRAAAGVLVHAVDVTAQVRARQRIEALAVENARLYHDAQAEARARAAERDRLQQVLDVLPEGVLIADARLQVLMANPAAAELLGRDLVGQTLPTSDPDGYLRFGTQHLDGSPCPTQHLDGSPYPTLELAPHRAVLRGEAVQGERFLLRNARTGQPVPVLANGVPVRDADGAIVGAVVVFQDISPLREVERQKDEFLASASHDLKNPLTSIKGLAQLLLRRAARLTEPEGACLIEGLRGIDQAASRMAALVTELLDTTRLQMGFALELDPHPMDLMELVRRVVQEQQQLTDQHDLQLVSTVDPLVGVWDAPWLERVLDNLLANAIKYSPGGGAITVTVARDDAASGPEAVVSVSDQGIGIPEEELSRVFERFYRASNVVGQIAGTGIGLAGARQIVEQHGGRISVRSRVGEGSTFSVRLPLVADNAPAVRA